MDEIGIGDIVAPKYTHKRKKLGPGIVVQITPHEHYPYTVAFPSEEQLFVLHNFDLLRIDKVAVNFEKRKEIITACYTYKQMQRELAGV